jgi:regulator of replication initiation timing
MANVADEVISELQNTVGQLYTQNAVLRAQAKELVEAKDAEIAALNAELNALKESKSK